MTKKQKMAQMDAALKAVYLPAIKEAIAKSTAWLESHPPQQQPDGTWIAQVPYRREYELVKLTRPGLTRAQFRKMVAEFRSRGLLPEEGRR